jgi:hypothetical protein
VRVRLFGGKWNPVAGALKRACPETKGLKSLAVRPLSGQCNPTNSALARAQTSIKEVLSRAGRQSQGQDGGPDRSRPHAPGSLDRSYPQRCRGRYPAPTTPNKGSGESANFDLLIRVSNDELERPSDAA